MRFLKYAFYLALMVVLIVLALANRQWVSLNLLPPEAQNLLPLSIELPLFVVILAAILFGVLVGYVLEYFREYKHRRRATLKSREAAHLAYEVEKLKKDAGKEEDEILALLK